MKKNGDSVRDWAGKIFRRFLIRTSLMVTLGVLGLYHIFRHLAQILLDRRQPARTQFIQSDEKSD